MKSASTNPVPSPALQIPALSAPAGGLPPAAATVAGGSWPRCRGESTAVGASRLRRGRLVPRFQTCSLGCRTEPGRTLGVAALLAVAGGRGALGISSQLRRSVDGEVLNRSALAINTFFWLHRRVACFDSSAHGRPRFERGRAATCSITKFETFKFPKFQTFGQ